MHFYVGKYISLEAKIAKNKDLYYDALAASQEGWHEGQDDPIPFVKYLLGTILSAYRDFADRFAIVETKHSAIEKVRMANWPIYKTGYQRTMSFIKYKLS